MNWIVKTWLILALLTMEGFICEDVQNSNYFLSDEFINKINSANLTWKAKRNFHPSTSRDFLRKLLGVLPDDGTHQLPQKRLKHGVKHNIPQQFDAREKWPQCPSIAEIYSQGGCGSCWAVSSANAMSDRLCIHSNDNIQVHVSVQNLLCCSTSDGCLGGWPGEAWKFWQHNGLVSGGPYHSYEGCQPYQETSVGLRYHPGQTQCHEYCDNEHQYSIPYEQDKSYGIDAYKVSESMEEIQWEIMNNGPVVAIFDVYEDFTNYGHGVYEHHNGPQVGLHAVRLLGWGEENGTPYWLAANSHGEQFGDLGGFFKILRGDNHCRFEQDITAGIPRV